MKQQAKRWLTLISCNAYCRRLIPFFDDWYAGAILGDPIKKAVSSSQVVGLYRSVFFWRYAPRKYTGGVLLNLMGLQFFRYYFYNLRYLIRFQRGILADEIKLSGIIIKPQTFSFLAIDRILSFYKKNQHLAENYFRDFSELIIANTRGPKENLEDYVAITKLILDECGIKKFGHDLIGLPLKINPFISILHYKSFVDQLHQTDGQDTPHADVFYPSFKIFVYLNEVSENNGAFRYLAGSNRFNMAGATRAYLDSLSHYLGGGQTMLKPTNASLNCDNGELMWMSASGRPGDAIFFNVQGVHRRGDFRKDCFRERLVLLIDFRQAEAPWQSFAADV